MPTQQRFRTILTARLLLEYRDQLLYLAQTKANGGGYTLPGGKIEGLEFAKDALVREAFEEVGVMIERTNLNLVHITHRKLKSVVEIIFLFHATDWLGEVEVKEPIKFREVKWFPTDETPERLTAVLKYTLDRFAKGKFYSEFPKIKKKSEETEDKEPKTKKKNKSEDKSEKTIKDKLEKSKNSKKEKGQKKKQSILDELLEKQ